MNGNQGSRIDIVFGSISTLYLLTNESQALKSIIIESINNISGFLNILPDSSKYYSVRYEVDFTNIYYFRQ